MKIPKPQSNLVAILIQILIWLVLGLALMFYQPFPGDIAVPRQLWIKQAIVLGTLAGAYYLNAFVLVPVFLLKSRTGYYLLFMVLLLAGILTINNFSDKWLNIHPLMDAAFHQHGPPRPRRDHAGSHFDAVTLMIAALVLGISTSVTTIQKWQTDKQHNQVLQQEKTSSELSFLKAQINPHFFFNTLNNIYALTHINVDNSRKAIHQLSRMMRYLLYETQQATTLLSQEIAFIKDYISLMQLRLTDAVVVEFQSPELLKDVPVAPMIFLPFVENAFKHGISATRLSTITIIITQDEDKTLQLTVQNSVFKDQSLSLDEYSGIGLNNTRRRLDLLYPGKYELLINELAADNKYYVHLTINLT